MKKMFVLSMFISFAMICSCQKQDSIAEAQLAQRKTELDVREEALVQREKAVVEREKALANSRVIQPQRQAPDAAQAEAERQRRIQQLPPELRALIPDRSRIQPDITGKNPAAQAQQRAVRTPRSVEDAQKKKGIGGAFASPAAEVPQADASSPSPTPE
jgi:hypothetical protein